MSLKITTITLLAVAAFGQPPGPRPSGDGIWNRNAAYGEVETFDPCNGHQPGEGTYHYHLNPICLRAQLDDNVVAVSTGRLGTQYAEKADEWTHSKILGWALDGHPIYGPYGYSDPMDPKSSIKRVQPGFQLRSITQRHTLPDWALSYHGLTSPVLNRTQYGPDVSDRFPLGRYVEDYEYAPGTGDLDQYNGRFTATPEYPGGTYAYFVTLSPDGNPAFPYVINVQFYGTVPARSAPGSGADYFRGGALTGSPSDDPRLASWYTKGSLRNAVAISGLDPSAGASTTWPKHDTPSLADTQRIQYDAQNVYVTSNDLPSYPIGPWFDAMGTSGVFINWPERQTLNGRFPRNPSPAANKPKSELGAVGMWVNGVAIFNTLDGASYSSGSRDDVGGGLVSPRAMHVSAASDERGPLAAGSIVSAYAELSAVLATTTEKASGAVWPLDLGGTTVTVVDSAGARLRAAVGYASPTLVTYLMPRNAATGPGEVIITSGGTAVRGKVNIVPTYPGIARARNDNLAAANTLTVDGDKTITGSAAATNDDGQVVPAPIDLSAGSVYLTLNGTGIGTAAVTATIGDVDATVAESGPQPESPGLDYVTLLIPSSLAGKGKLDVVVTAAGKPSNPVYIVIQ
ncbi:MAG: YHYH protein [Acidobacteria bacterium]|nr:YHYH protein [Acidobacteriota bacterium]